MSPVRLDLDPRRQIERDQAMVHNLEDLADVRALARPDPGRSAGVKERAGAG
jgi:hypothetical protein